MSDVHRAAANGFAAAAATYVRGRPDYPPQVEDWLKGELGLGPGRVAVDLGAGTGKFQPRLLATGARVIAVEPVPAMLARLVELNPGAEARAGSAERIPLNDGSVDVVVCAQSFHWFANPAALAEIRRVLKLGGGLGLAWNVRDERVGWVAALTEIFRPYEGDAPRYYTMRWRNVFPAEGFGPLAERHLPHGHSGAPERVIVDRVLSTSFVAALGSAEREDVAAKVRALIAATPALAGKSEVVFPYVTALCSCVRIA
jgi:SAM-dependent methyltransferase